MQILLTLVTIALLAGCSSYNNAFECKVGKGVSCTSVSKINNMVDSGAFNGAEVPVLSTSNKKIKKETIKVANKTPFPIVLPNNFHN